MADWSAIRRLADQRHAETRAGLKMPEDALISADQLIAKALDHEGLGQYPLTPSDPLLAGAHAILDRESYAIWHNGNLPATTTRFNLAHELAHWWLHGEAVACSAEEIVQDPVSDPLPFGQEYISGYSPAQRREVEANVFAAEFLLPGSEVERAFLAGMTADDIVAATGLSESAVISQMAEALLAAPGVGPRLGEENTPSEIRLDESQRAAAEVERGPVLVIAGPGTGKTRTLVSRILVLLDRGVPPEEILALTFSNKAANEMRERLEALVPDAALRLWIGTFHAFGLELLRRFGTNLGLPPAPVLLDPLDAITLMERHLADLDLREYEYLHDPAFPLRDILSAISRAKDELTTPEEYARLADAMAVSAADEKEERRAAKVQETARVYAVWQEILQRTGRLDFGDLLMRSVELLERHPDVRSQVRGQFSQVLVDEYQDINRASAVLVKLMAGEGEGLWAVGDLRQAIYRFRGASPANLSAFEEDYPGGRRLTLDVNYRSGAPLVELFGAAASRMTGEPSVWQPHRSGADAPVFLAEAEDETAQADGIAEQIRQFEREGFSLSNQAILCRTNAQAERLSKELEARGVPVVFLGDLFARPEVKDMLALLSLAAERNGQGLARVAQFPEYSVPDEVVSSVFAWAKENHVSFPQALSAVGYPQVAALHGHIAPLAFRGDAYAFLARYLFGPTAYLRLLLQDSRPSARQQRLALHQLLLLARAHASRLDRQERRPQRAFLDHVRRLIATQEDSRVRTPAGGDAMEGVRLLTVHGSKGLEFPVVFIPNLAKDLFPPRKPVELATPPPGLTGDVVEREGGEEERLFFVALSRARDRLVLSRPLTVSGRPRAASPLLHLIEAHPSDRGASKCHWPRGADDSRVPLEPEQDRPGLSSAEAPEDYSLAAVEQYMRCPRQFYYQRVLSLPHAQERSAYRSFQECVWRVLRWVRNERANGHTTTQREAEARLAEVWAECGPVGHPQEAMLRRRAGEMIGHMLTAAPGGQAGREPEDRSEMVVDLSQGRIRLPVDHVTEDESRITVEQYDSGRPTDRDHTAPRHALTRRALKQEHGDKSTEVQLRYLATGETKVVPEQARWEPQRVAKYDEALRRMKEGDFPPRPSNDLCARCPFLFICPTPDR
jgi:DNA helicase II / ATP-dependent DNA helicase PcrA